MVCAATIVGSLLFGIACSALAQTSGPVPTAGVDASGGFGLALGPGINAPTWGSPYESPLSHAEYRLIAQAGFKLVRQPILSRVLFTADSSCTVRSKVITQILYASAEAAQYKMTLVVDLHPSNSAKRELLNDLSAGCLKSVWLQLTEDLHARAANVAFEILNEPSIPARQWWGTQKDIIEAIRTHDTGRVVLASAGSVDKMYPVISDTAQALVSERPYAIDRVVYVFHDYSPLKFTHQGIWLWKKDSGTAWEPATGDKINTRTAYSTFPEIGSVEAWSKRYGVPVLCDELGVFAEGGVSDGSRLRYLRAITYKLDSERIPWAIWQFAGAFGIAERRRGESTVFQRGVLGALRLRSAARASPGRM